MDRKILVTKLTYIPVVTDLPELISWNTADIPDFGCDEVDSELRRDVAGGGGGTAGALDGVDIVEVGVGAEVISLAVRLHTRPKG